MSRLSRATTAVARWLLAWWIPRTIARRAIADAARKSRRAEACLRIARRLSREKELADETLRRAQDELSQAKSANEAQLDQIARLTSNLEDYLLWRERENAQKQADIAHQKARMVRASEHLKLDGDL